MTTTAVFFGCAKDSQDEPSPAGPYIRPAASLAEARAAAAQSQVSCRESDCNASVGMLVTVTGLESGQYGVGQCTASLISDNIALTNSHCLEPGIRSGRQSCKNAVWVQLPATALHGTTKIGCEEVMATASLSTDREAQGLELDYAFIKLESSARRPTLTVSTLGLPDELPLSLFKMTPVESASIPSGTMERLACSVVHLTSLIPSFANPHRPIATVWGCDGLHGNSGAPFLDSAGTIRAMLQAKKDSAEARGRKVIIASNTACIPYGVSNASALELKAISPECAITPLSSDGKNAKLEVPANGKQRFNKRFQERLNQWSASEARFGWNDWPIASDNKLYSKISGEFTSLRDEVESKIVSLQIGCFRNPSSWLDEFSSGRILRNYAPSGNIRISIPVWKMATVKNLKLQLGLRLLESFKTIGVRVTFSPRELKNTGKSKTTVRLDDLDLGNDVLSQGTLETCH